MIRAGLEWARNRHPSESRHSAAGAIDPFVKTLGDVVQFCHTAGYVASGLVVMAFCMKDIIWLRIIALASNLAFLTYGLGLGLAPVWLLHAILLPINCWRLWQALSYRWAPRHRAFPPVPGLD